jgi:hypothetical protein
MKTKEKPILFSTSMVQAILAGNKSMTRRIIKPQPIDEIQDAGNGLFFYKNPKGNPNIPIVFKPRYQPGDILYVKETYAIVAGKYKYKADMIGVPKWEDVKCKSSLFMPRAAARIFLKVTDVKAERLQDITEEDAMGEGVDLTDTGWCNYLLKGKTVSTAKQSFATLWDSINGKKSWHSNPWVWVISFEQLKNHNQ